MTLKWRVRAYIGIDLEVSGPASELPEVLSHVAYAWLGDEALVSLTTDMLLDASEDQEIPAFLDLLDKTGEGLNLPEIRRRLLKYGYPAEWWPEEEEEYGEDTHHGPLV